MARSHTHAAVQAPLPHSLATFTVKLPLPTRIMERVAFIHKLDVLRGQGYFHFPLITDWNYSLQGLSKFYRVPADTSGRIQAPTVDTHKISIMLSNSGGVLSQCAHLKTVPGSLY
ncbi:hypothetical protein Taro_032578 [Colocasia esculenta]|uniref:Uncharacterized protein n=1 Tax=Colocasia esculenta TaxID=4460 RepID=A0A843VXQ1_COLES|nr:hypothetical protein [Colocasia esculenta]